VPVPRGDFSIGIATQDNNIDEVHRLLAQGANIEAVNEVGATALIRGSQLGHTQIVKLLLESGANSNAKTKRRTTSLHVAADHGHLDIVKLLIQHGSDINAVDANGATALLYAAQKGDLTIVNTLLATNQLDPNITNDFGATPLFVAAAKGHLNVVKKLLATGADAKKEAWSDQTAYDVAVMNGHEEVAKLLKDSAMLGSTRGTSGPVRDAVSEVPGGIDMNEINLDRAGEQLPGGGAGIQFNMQGMEPLLNMDIQGFSPVIIDMIPLNSVLPLLGLMPTEKGIKYGQEEVQEELQLSMN
jgi:hypothetical protein